MLTSLPLTIQPYWQDAHVTVVKNKKRSSVYKLDHDNSGSSYYLKITPRGEMETEALMTRHLSMSGLCVKIQVYIQDGESDYLLTECLSGLDAASPEYLKQPEWLAEVFAHNLKKLHGIPYADCPRHNGLSAMLIRAKQNYRDGRVENGLLRYLGVANKELAYIEMMNLSEAIRNNDDDGVVIHGDYCLPNLILNGIHFSGFVDVGYGGIGDRHYDLYWGLWSLQHNLHSGHYAERFLDTYGREKVDERRLRLCGLLSAFNGFRGQDYYEL